MNRSKIVRYGVWLVPPLIGAAAMLAFLLLRDSGGETFTPPAAVGEQDLPGTPVAPEKIQEARDFKGWPLWWLGESFDSLSLTAVDQFTPESGSPSQNAVYFIYGTCIPRPDAGGCGPPLSVVVQPLCWVPPERITGVKRGDTFDFRGAKALWVDDHLRIWTGDSTIAIFGSRDRILRAADAIVPLGNIPVTLTDSKLPPSNFESCPETPIYPTPFPYPPTRTP
jgi:hypothetical protein